jgi:hypothetical protein
LALLLAAFPSLALVPLLLFALLLFSLGSLLTLLPFGSFSLLALFSSLVLRLLPRFARFFFLFVAYRSFLVLVFLL